jgi:circadian clock protein KaiC
MARVRTGVVEFDKMLRGGFMERDAVMIAGSPGTGKTTLGLQYLVNGASEFGENGIYVTFEQMPDQIYRDATAFGWDLRKLEQENKIKLVCTSPDLLIGGDGEHLLDENIRQLKPRRIVIDSLSHLGMYVEEKNLRKETYRLLNYFKSKGLTCLSTWETSQIAGQELSVTEFGVSFLVDCIILLRLVEIESTMRKALVVLKMRGSDHDRALREFTINSHGIKLSKPFSGFQGVVTGIPFTIPRKSR